MRPSSGKPPTTLQELFVGSRRVATELFDAPSYAHALLFNGELERDYQTAMVRGEFDLNDSGRARIARHDAERLISFLDGTLLAGLEDVRIPAPGSREDIPKRPDLIFKSPAELTATMDIVREWDSLYGPTMKARARRRDKLRSVKFACAVLFHEQIHALGPPDQGVMSADWETYYRSPHGRLMCEGATEVATELWLDEFIERCGLLKLAPDLKNVTMEHTVYATETAAMRQLFEWAAERTDSSLPQVVTHFVRDGTADLPLQRMLERIFTHAGLDRLPRTVYADCLSESYEELTRALDIAARRGWTADGKASCEELLRDALGKVDGMCARGRQTLVRIAAQNATDPRPSRATSFLPAGCAVRRPQRRSSVEGGRSDLA